MRELERRSPHTTATESSATRVAIVGSGRLGTALARALCDAGVAVEGPLTRGATPVGVDAVLLCVPDAEIAAAAALIPGGVHVGHCSGATGLEALGDRPAFSMHPLMAVTAAGASFAGASAAIAGSSPQMLELARELAARLGMRPIEVDAPDRVAYHAAASIASNFLIALEGAAEQLAATAGVTREDLLPLVRATVENWGRLGAARALTGPIARGDAPTVEAHRAVIRERQPQLLELFDALVATTQSLAQAAGATVSPDPTAAPIKTIRTVATLREELSVVRRWGATIGLVPTMGAFHDGHLSLMRAARRECDVVVVSLFVNPRQFNDTNDLSGYPRDEPLDSALAAELGVDILFAPPAEEVYPPGFATMVSTDGPSAGLEGMERGRGHFDGVTTVVTKLLNMVGPHLAYFGQKDAQQVAVVRRLIRDLNIPARLVVCPTVRAQDGLALSSRNVLLTASDRRRAPALHRSLQAVRRAAVGGERNAAAALAAGRRELEGAGISPEYLELVDPESMLPAETIDRDVLAVIAARFGAVRLIDNLPIACPAEGHTARHGRSDRASRTTASAPQPRRGGDPRAGRQPA